ncbi:vWA domain-containing protein [Intrasporangium mesophilum]
MSAEQAATLAKWRALALQRMPYFAPILFGLSPLDAPCLGTFAVDHHWRLYVDFEAVAAKGDLWCSESLLHECGHIFGEHYERAKDLGLIGPEGAPITARDAKLMNVAADFAVNDDLVEAGCTTLADMLSDLIGEPRHETAEHYFAALKARQPQQQSRADQQDQPGNLGDEESQGQPRFAGCGSVSGGQPAPCELPADDPTAPAATTGEKERKLLGTAALVQAHAKNHGTVPAGLLAQATATLAPSKVPWQKVLGAALRNAAKIRPGDVDLTYLRRNRRRPTTRLSPTRALINPGTFAPVPSVVLVRDTSGSMSDANLSAVTSETEAIARRVGIRGVDFRIIDTDAKAYRARGYKGTATMATVEGRGGTDMRVGIAAAVALGPRPHVVVVATDGLTAWPSVPVPGVKLIACIVGADEATAARVSSLVPEFIRTVIVEVGPTS